MLHPLTVNLRAFELTALLEASISGSDSSFARFTTGIERQRCLDLLSWSRSLDGAVAISVYPSEEDGLEDLEILNDGSGDSPQDDQP
jgi:hypothetical protein